MAGTPAAGKPLAGMCDSGCPQATHHPCHRPVWADAVASTTAFIGGLSRTRTADRAILQTELHRAQRVVASIDAAAAATGSRRRRTAHQRESRLIQADDGGRRAATRQAA
jgi:hypothetical protein